jgi:addiction module RelE/StbE family toxin
MINKINNPRIEFTELFNKQRKAVPHEIKMAFREALFLFLEDSTYPQLRNHPLRGKLSGYRSIDVTEDWRAIFKQTQTTKQKIVTFHKIGTHKTLYKK